MKLGNLTGADKVWVPLVVAGVAVGAHYGVVSGEQASFLKDNAVVVGAMILQAVAVFATTNKA